MSYTLKQVTNGTTFYITDNKSYFLGRKETDFLISDDRSVSRRHAKLTRESNNVTITDLGSTYKTFHNKVALEKNVEITLVPGDEIRFGELSSIFKFEEHPIVSTGTRLSSSLKKQITNDIRALGGEYCETWHDGCTHLTVHEISLTIKVLQALIDNKPIVTPSYWRDCLTSVKLHQDFPNVRNYVPPMAEALLNRIELNQGIDRTQLFVGKLFIFFREENKKSLEPVIRKAGGVCYSWEKKPFTLEDIVKSPKEILLIQTPDPYEDPALDELIDILKKKGKRVIPQQELALAVIMGSCEKNCNPSYNRTAEVFRAGGHKLQTQHTLVADTQSEIFSIGSYQSQETGFVPDTFENTIFPSKACNSKDATNTATTDIIIEKLGQTKRPHPDTEHEMENSIEKKIKTDKTVVGKRDLTLIQDDSAIKSSNLKRKAADVENETPDYENPFAALKKCRNNTDKKITKSNNPFAGMLIKQEAVSERRSAKKHIPEEGASASKKQTVSDHNIENKMELTVTSPPEKVDLNIQTKIHNTNHEIITRTADSSYIPANMSNSGWINKKSGILSETKLVPMDTEMLSFIELFQGTILADVLPNNSIRQPVVLDQTNGSCKNKNVKKFSKQCTVKKTATHKSTFITVDPDNTVDIVDTRKQFDDDDNEDENKSRNQGSKRKAPRKFLI